MLPVTRDYHYREALDTKTNGVSLKIVSRSLEFRYRKRAILAAGIKWPQGSQQSQM